MVGLLVNIITNILDFFIIYHLYCGLKRNRRKYKKTIWIIILLWGAANGIFINYVDLNYFKFVINISVLVFIWYLHRDFTSIFLLYGLILMHVSLFQIIIIFVMSKFISDTYLLYLSGQSCTAILLFFVSKLPIYKIFDFIVNEVLYKFVFIILFILLFIILYREFKLVDIINQLPFGIILLISLISIYQKIFYYTAKYPAIKHDLGNMIASIYVIVNRTNDIEKIRTEINNIIAQMGYDAVRIKEYDSVESFIKLKEEQNPKFKIEFDNKYYEDNINVPVSVIIRMLGILVDNAIEASPEGSIIQVYVLSGERNLLIKVGNICKNMFDVNEIFEKGYSTKGSDGYGLYNLNKLLEEYNGHIDINIEGKKVFFCVVIM